MNIFYLLSAALINANDVGIKEISADAILSNGLNALYFIAGAVAVVVIIVAGINYSTSGGNAESVTKAKNTILFAVAGLVIIMLAFVITKFVIERF